MMEKPIYIIDASSLIEIESLVLKDFFLPLFRSLENLIRNGSLISHEEVLTELKRKDGTEGDIFKWANKQNGLFVKTNASQWSKAKEIIKSFRNLIDPGKRNNADPFIISLALIKEGQQKLFQPKYTIVTEEVARNNANKPMIPDVCNHYKIECLNLNGFLKKELEMSITVKNNG